MRHQSAISAKADARRALASSRPRSLLRAFGGRSGNFVMVSFPFKEQLRGRLLKSGNGEDRNAIADCKRESATRARKTRVLTVEDVIDKRVKTSFFATSAALNLSVCFNFVFRQRKARADCSGGPLISNVRRLSSQWSCLHPIRKQRQLHALPWKTGVEHEAGWAWAAQQVDRICRPDDRRWTSTVEDHLAIMHFATLSAKATPSPEWWQVEPTPFCGGERLAA